MNKSQLLLAILCLAALSGCQKSTPVSPIDQVHVFNGTGFHGHTYPGATTPYGLVQLSPDTRTYGWDGCSGYHYSDSAILGFSHTHLSGTGCADLGDFLVTPGLGTVEPLQFSHDDEYARPGYYKVVFPVGITAELTAAPHTGVHRYTFSGEGPRRILVDALHGIGDETHATQASLQAVAHDEIKGHRRVDGWIRDRDIYLSAKFSVPFLDAVQPVPGKLLLSFADDVREITIYAGISYTGAEAAKGNRVVETRGRSFDEVCAITTDDWSSSLGSIVVEGGPTEQFYTCFYHTLVCPNNIADTGQPPYYSTLSLWDTFRSWNPLQTIINPGLVGDMASSMLKMYHDWGELPIWPLAYGETGCMIGYHSVSVLADAWLRGIRSFDGEEALLAMVASSNRNKLPASELYLKYGYIPADRMAESVSQTLEFSYDDWCIARMAESLDFKEIAEEYQRRARNWRNVFDPATGFMRGHRSDGSWMTPFDPIGSTREYTEAIPWQSRFFVPHDPAGHAEMMGGRDAMLAALDSLFTFEDRSAEVRVSDITGLKGQYAHGNEPSHHMAWLYNWYGKPSMSQKVVRELLGEMYDITPEGVCGNEDCGQMSAWYVLASLGIYPACPGTGEYVLAAPLFKKAAIALGNGNALTITADHPGRPYISDVKLNGRTLPRNYITYDEIMAGGTLEFSLSSRPVKSRENLPAPYSMSTHSMVSTPAVLGDIDLFRDRTEITLATRTEGAAIHYTLDGSEPTQQSPVYTGPFTLEETTRIRARAWKEGCEASPEAFIPVVKAFFQPADGVTGLGHGCSYTYHRGVFTCTADVLASPVVSRGTLPMPSIDQAPDEDHFGYVFTGWIDVPEDGIWSFALMSDDGSVLDIDGVRVVDNDGSHSAIVATGRIPLLKGLHPYRLVYLEDYEGNSLRWAWKAEGEARFRPIDFDYLYRK